MTIVERYGTVLRCYDNGGKTCDRYTVIPPRWAKEEREYPPGTFNAIAASENPFHPQGFGQHCSAMAGPHLGKRIGWAMLPRDVQRFARQSFPDYAPPDKDRPFLFTASEEDKELLHKITTRYREHFPKEDWVQVELDFTACHLNGCPLDLAALFATDDFNFLHDVCGIRDNLDRTTGRFTTHFWPRFAWRAPT